MSKVVLIRDENGEEQPYEVENGVSLELDEGGRQFFYLPADGTVPITDTSLTNVGLYEYAQVQDADLVSGNIKSGVNILGVPGDPNVVDTSDGDATAADILSGKTAYVQGQQIVGTGSGGSGGEGPGWLPTSADYTWEYVYFNKYASDIWAQILPNLIYDSNHQCVIAQTYESEGVLASPGGMLVAYDFTSEFRGYCVGYYKWYDVQHSMAEGVYPIYSTMAMYTEIVKGEDWVAGMNELSVLLNADEQLSYSLIPVINEPISDSLSGWDALWAGNPISFGDFDNKDDRMVGVSIINNTISNLTTDVMDKWFGTDPVAASGITPYSIREHFFLGSTALKSIINTSGYLRQIRDFAFYHCTALETVQLEGYGSQQSLTTIGVSAFNGCTSLTKVVLSVMGSRDYYVNFNQYAFDGCTNMHTLVCNIFNNSTYGLPRLGSSVFSSTNLQHIYVPESNVNDYKAASGWSDYSSIIEACGYSEKGDHMLGTRYTSSDYTYTNIYFTATTDSGESRNYENLIYRTNTSPLGLFATWNGSQVKLADVSGTDLVPTSLMANGKIRLQENYWGSTTEISALETILPVITTMIFPGDYLFVSGAFIYEGTEYVYEGVDASFKTSTGVVHGDTLMMYCDDEGDGAIIVCDTPPVVYTFAIKDSSSTSWTCLATDNILTIGSEYWSYDNGLNVFNDVFNRVYY